MSNQIRPLHQVFDPEVRVVLEIGVESGVSTFTWIILDEHGRVVAGREMDRTPPDDGLPLGQEFSITVMESDTDYGEQLEGKDVASRDDDSPALAVPGNYQVQLYLGHPERRNTRVRTRFAKLQLLDEDAFTVSDSEGSELGTGESGSEGTDVGQPLRIALVREGPSGAMEQRSPVTYDAFRTFLEASWGEDDEIGRAHV